MKDNSNQIQPFDDGMADLLGYNPVWYWMMSFIILGIIMLTLFFLLRLKNDDNKKTNMLTPTTNRLPAEFAGEIDKSFLLVSNNAISPQEACQRVSIVLREYLHLHTGLPAGNMTVTELENVQASPRVVQNLRYLYPIVFGDKQVATYEEFLEFMNSSRLVIDGNWN